MKIIVHSNKHQNQHNKSSKNQPLYTYFGGSRVTRILPHDQISQSIGDHNETNLYVLALLAPPNLCLLQGNLSDYQLEKYQGAFCHIVLNRMQYCMMESTLHANEFSGCLNLTTLPTGLYNCILSHRCKKQWSWTSCQIQSVSITCFALDMTFSGMIIKEIIVT